MKPIRDRVKAALASPPVQNGIAQAFVGIMRDHIDESYGRAPGGGRVAHKPLKDLFGRAWKRKSDGGRVIRTRTVGKKKKRTEYLVEVPSYRNGGQPLRNTGAMWRSLNAQAGSVVGGLRVTLRGLAHAAYQDKGFSTNPPKGNFIPLTKKGARHATGANPKDEGMKRGKDYFMARRGVTVPARPFLLPTREDMGIIGRSIAIGLRSVFRGT